MLEQRSCCFKAFVYKVPVKGEGRPNRVAAHERKAYAVDQANVPLPSLQALIIGAVMQVFVNERDLDIFGKSLGERARSLQATAPMSERKRFDDDVVRSYRLISPVGNELLPYARCDRVRFIISIPYGIERGRVAEDQHSEAMLCGRQTTDRPQSNNRHVAVPRWARR
ncbi:MAG: hypothetical protein WBW87_12125 [Candidatus Cybelea sp.]